MSTAIEFESVGKMYRLGRVGTGTLCVVIFSKTERNFMDTV